MTRRSYVHPAGSRPRPAVPAALGVLLLAAGCSAPPRFLAETFDGPPRSMSAYLGEDRWSLASIPAARSRSDLPPDGVGVINGRLLAGGRRLYRAEFPFHAFRGACDFMAAGGILEGSAGIFIEERRGGDEGAPRPAAYTLALNGRGEWRAYRGLPDRPFGVVPWKPLPDRNPAMPRVLGVEAGAATVRFLVDDRVVASFGELGGGPPPPEGEERMAGGQSPERRVGLFADQLLASFDNFVFWSTGADGPAGPPASAGAAGEGQRLVDEATGRAAAFRARPTRSGLLEVIEARTAAERSFPAGDQARAEAATETVHLLVALEEAAAQAGAEDLLRMAARARDLPEEARQALMDRPRDAHAARAREAQKAKKPLEALVFWLAAGEVERTAESTRQVEELAGVLDPPLTFEYVRRQESATSAEFGRQVFYSVVRSIYGGLPEKKGGEIKVEVAVKEAKLSEEVEDSLRKVAGAGAAGAMTAGAQTELARLSKSLPEDLRDAEARARLARGIDLDGRKRFTVFEYRARPREVLEEDSRSLKQAATRIADLEKRRREASGAEGASIGVPARLHTDSARVRLTYRLSSGEGAESAGAIEVYEAIEQWEHPADPRRGIEASAWSRKDRDRMVDSVRNRTLSRLRLGIALEAALAKLGKDEATRLIVRFARATRDEEDRSRVEWRLKSVYGLEGSTLERVTARLLEAREGT